jgi:hypothetical protein
MFCKDTIKNLAAKNAKDANYKNLIFAFFALFAFFAANVFYLLINTIRSKVF